MAHLSLYRAFRPDTFDKMVRQEHVVRILKNQIGTDAVGHAYLFCGPRGTGKTSVARIFARAVNCERPENGSPCGKCATCRALSEGGNLDVVEIDAASNNGVNEMRDLREKVQYPPVSGRYKVYIIDEVHMLTDSAFNALLKTLEEPPRHAIFILATTEPQKIPATILSRCMRLDFKLIPEEDLEAHLKRVLKEIGKEYDDEAVAAIARAGAGSDRDMLSIAEMCISYSDKLTYESVTAVLGTADFYEMCALGGAILSADTAAALDKTEKILSEGKSVGVLCRDILQFLNQVAVVRACRNAERILSLPKEMFAAIGKVAEGADGHAVLRATEVFAKAETDLRFASSPRICLETAVVRSATPAADYDIDALLARVNELERQVAALSQGKVSVRADAVSEPPVKAAEPQTSAPREEDGEFPTEEPQFEEAYFSYDEPPRQPARRAKAPSAQAAQRAPEAPRPAVGKEASEASRPPRPAEDVAPPSPAQTPVPTAPAEGEQDAQTAFGRFMRTLRKTSRNGVLFTMCSDLEAAFEGNVLVLTTDSETVFRSLGREEHRAVMAQAFAQVGVSDFVVRMRAKAQDDKKGLEQLKRDFPDYPIEVK